MNNELASVGNIGTESARYHAQIGGFNGFANTAQELQVWWNELQNSYGRESFVGQDFSVYSRNGLVKRDVVAA